MGRSFLLILTGVAVFLIPALQAKGQPSSTSQTSSACDSFGIQRPQGKREAPPFTLKTLDGSQVNLFDFKGKPVLLKFWATWCPSCVEELPMMEKFSAGRRDQLVILMAAVDGEKEGRVRRVIKENKITLPVLLDAKEKTIRAYGLIFVPVSFLINSKGLIVGIIVGERDWSSPEAWSAVKELLDLR